MPAAAGRRSDGRRLNGCPLSLLLLGLVAVAHANGSGTPTAAAAQQSVRTIQAIQFSGNTRLSSLKLSKAIGIKAGDASTSEAIDAAMTKIVAAYRAIGSDLALMVDVTLTDASHTRVNFLIDEHGTGGNKGAAPRSGARMGGAPPPPPPATRQ